MEITAATSGKSISEEEVIRIRKDKLAGFFKSRFNAIVYVLLAVVVYLSVRIRTANLAGLRDITTGGWTLGPDLDPFLFLRWAEYIVEHGKIMAMDMMRYVPLGFDTQHELVFHVYLITWFHKIAVLFGSDSVAHSAVLYPVFMFALTVIAFFLMTRKIFLSSLGKKKAGIIALIASFFLSVFPSLIPRTVAGIPEKEASGILFLFLAFYFFLVSWNSEGKAGRYIFGLLAGASTAIMGLTWGGHIYIYATIGPLVFISFLLGKVNKEAAWTYLLWLVSSFVLLLVLTERYPFMALLTSTTTGPCLFVLLLIIIDFALFDMNLKRFAKNKFNKIPRRIFSLIISLVLLLIITLLVFGPSFIFDNVVSLKNQLVTPVADRLGMTVAENRQPYFTEWEGSFGPHIKEIALTFWLFFLGSVYLFYCAAHSFKKKEKLILTISFFVLLLTLIFSRYSQDGRLNGTNFLSLFFYALGPILFILAVGYYYYKFNKSGELDKFTKIDFNLLFLLLFFLISLISARSAIRLIMMLVPSASIMIAYFVVDPLSRALKIKEQTIRVICIALTGIILLTAVFSAYNYYYVAVGTAQAHVPSVYTQQWQKAMSWVRESTPENAVFGHWWDYGYWLQSIGRRATVVDGGNAISYWNYFMGRYALTGKNNTEALEFLYAHNATHFLIDSTDIGKYGAFSSIGSDENYDRASFIPTFIRDSRQSQEKKNSTVFAYVGGAGLDGDIIYDSNGTKIFLPAGIAGLGAILVEQNSAGGEVISQPEGIFVYQNQQYRIPFRYAFDGEFKDFGSGIEAGIFLMPRASISGSNIQLEEDGALLYLSERTAKSQFARLYLYKENNPNFKLVHTEEDFLIAQIKNQNPTFDHDLINYGGAVTADGQINRGEIRGPIRIWEIHYPTNIQFKKEYLETAGPAELQRA